MAPPTRTFTSLVAGDVAQGVPISTGLLAALAQEQEHMHELLCPNYASLGTCSNQAHDHMYEGGHPLNPGVGGWNMLMNSAPDKDGVGDWQHSKSVEVIPNKGFLFSGKEGEFAWQWAPMNGPEMSQEDIKNFAEKDERKVSRISRAAYGDGARLTPSVYLRTVGTTLTQGTISFGYADGGTGFAAGCECVVDYTDLSSSWKRFYGFVDRPRPDQDTRLIVKTTEEINGGVAVTALMHQLGWGLNFWMPAILDKSSSGDEHDDWGRYGLTDCPFGEYSIAITDAVRIYPV